MLTESFSQSGIVQRGNMVGQMRGYPTANIPLTLVCEAGTYAGEVHIESGEKMHPAAVYIDTERKLLEAHLLDFTGDLYGKTITVTAFKKIAERQDIREREKLQAFIGQAVTDVRKFFAVKKN